MPIESEISYLSQTCYIDGPLERCEYTGVIFYIVIIFFCLYLFEYIYTFFSHLAKKLL